MLNNAYLKFKVPLTLLLSFFCVLAFTGCARFQQINFDVKTPGFKQGVFIIKNNKGEIAYSANIKNGALKLDKQIIEEEGYYTLKITNNAVKGEQPSFEVYLQPGTYTIETSATEASFYPKITSTSAIQNELTAYYTAVSLVNSRKFQESQNKLMINMLQHLSKEQVLMLIKQQQQKTAEQNQPIHDKYDPDNAEKLILQQFVKQYPKSITAAHIMSSLSYQSDPVTYYAIYNNMSEDTRLSDEGKELGKKLRQLIKLVPGQPAPAIVGKTPDGKSFNISDLKKRVYILEFWKATNELSRLNHNRENLGKTLFQITDPKQVGMISLSLDENRNWWRGAITDDKLNWPQFSDLKGDESENVVNWSITRIPTYYLVDTKWHIIARDVSWPEVPVMVNDYLNRH